MSRIRTGHRPDDWQPEGPAAARLVRHGGGPVEEVVTRRSPRVPAAFPVSEARREQLAEAQRRYRERDAV